MLLVAENWPLHIQPFCIFMNHMVSKSHRKSFKLQSFGGQRLRRSLGKSTFTMLIMPTGTFAIGDSPVDGPTLQCVSCAKKDSLRGTIMMA